MSDDIRNEGSDQQSMRLPGERDGPGAAAEVAGVPEHADDETPGAGQVDEPQRQPMPSDHLTAADDYGTTAAGARHGEPLASKLARENPDATLSEERVEPPVHEQTDTDEAAVDEPDLDEASEPHRPRSGGEQPWDPEDLAAAHGEDPTPDTLARRSRDLEQEGPAAIEKTVP